MSSPHDIWVVSDGAAGNELQAIALADALGGAVRTLRLRARWPWSALAPQWAPTVPASAWLPEPLQGPWPALAIGAGRTGAAALLSLRRATRGAVRTVQILDPRIDPAAFDLVIAPRHDALVGPSVIAIDGSLHAIDEAWLARERIAHARLGLLPSPRTVVFIGGPRRGVDMGALQFDRLGAALASARDAHGGSCVLIGSRRTPGEWAAHLRACVRADLAWFGGADGDNPYRGALAWGDRFIVSADSVNMLSEALGTGRPVYRLGEAAPDTKLRRYADASMAAGRLRAFEGHLEARSYTPLRELERILPEVRARLRWPE